MKFFYSALVILIAATGCLKEDEACVNVDPRSEDTTMTGFISRNGFVMRKDSAGFYYQILAPGSGARPTGTSRIRVRYVGKYLNLTTFEDNNNITGNPWVLNTLIQGWKLGLPYLQRGGKIRLVIPSALAYGCQGTGNIGANTVLFFEIELLDVL
jgi:FKBP-type peptidyl-prolyl cis-trans isomerase FkpA